MYNFINTNEIGEMQHSSIQTIFNGVNLDLKGYRTLTVTGRSLIGRRINSTEVPGTDGKYFLSSELEAREITVKFQVKANNNADYRIKLNVLNTLLHSLEPKELKFTDESDYKFMAILEKTGSIEETDNTVVSTYTFLCLDPYKYKNAQGDVGTDRVTITKLPNNSDEIIPDAIKLSVANAGDKIIIKNQNTTKKIVINHNFSSNDLVEVNLNNDYPLKINTVNKSELIDFVESDYDFSVKQNDVITVTNCKRVEIYTKERLY